MVGRVIDKVEENFRSGHRPFATSDISDHDGGKSALQPLTELVSANVAAARHSAFAQRYDPQPFHVDRSAAAASQFGGIIASRTHLFVAVWGAMMRAGCQVGTTRQNYSSIVYALSCYECAPFFQFISLHKPMFCGGLLRSTAVRIYPGRDPLNSNYVVAGGNQSFLEG